MAESVVDPGYDIYDSDFALDVGAAFLEGAQALGTMSFEATVQRQRKQQNNRKSGRCRSSLSKNVKSYRSQNRRPIPRRSSSTSLLSVGLPHYARNHGWEEFTSSRRNLAIYTGLRVS